MTTKESLEVVQNRKYGKEYYLVRLREETDVLLKVDDIVTDTK